MGTMCRLGPILQKFLDSRRKFEEVRDFFSYYTTADHHLLAAYFIACFTKGVIPKGVDHKLWPTLTIACGW